MSNLEFIGIIERIQRFGDENVKFRKSNMADSRHFENRYSSISQPRIVRIWRNLVRRRKFWVRRRKRDKNAEIPKFKMADGRHFLNHYISTYQPQIVQIARNLVCRHNFYRRRRKRQKNEKFANSKWRMDAALKITFWLQKSPASCPINMKFGVRRQNHTHTKHVKCLITKIQNSGRQYFGSGYTSVSEPRNVQYDEIWYTSTDFWHNGGNMTNKSEINIKRANIIFKNY